MHNYLVKVGKIRKLREGVKLLLPTIIRVNLFITMVVNLMAYASDIWDKFVEYVKSTHNVDLKVKVHQPQDAVDFPNFITSVQNANGGVFGLADVTITQLEKARFSLVLHFLLMCLYC